MSDEQIVETGLVTQDGKRVVVTGDSLAAASPLAKGGVLKGGSVAKPTSVNREELGRASSELLDSLRSSGAIQNTKFVVVYNFNEPEGTKYKGEDIIDNTIYTAGQTATVKFEDDEKGEVPYVSGYDFKGWATSPDAEVPTYPYDENDPQTYTITITDHDVILYAVWQMRTCTLTYALGDYGTGSVPAAQTVQEDAEVDIAFSPAPTVNDGSGRIFIGWSQTDGGYDVDDATYTADGASSIHLYSDLTLYPVFAAQYTLTYALGNDATGTVPSAETHSNGARANINFNPSVTCVSDNTKVFVGWSETDEDTTATYTSGGTDSIYMNRNVTLYPVFGAQAQGGGITIINNSTKGYTIDVYEDGSSILQINSSSQETLNFVDGEEYEIHTNLTNATFDGVYQGTQYSNVSLGHGNDKIYNPKTNNQYWEFSDGDSGTLTIS